MALQNSLAPQGKKTFSQALAADNVQKTLAESIKDPKQRNKFTADITSYVASNKMLQECDFVSILAAALQGNALGLSPITGEYWVIPYKTKDGYKAQFQLGLAGRIQLALRSGQVVKMATKDVREGEFKGIDPDSGDEIISFITDQVKRETLPIIGYRAYIKLVSGFEKAVYFSKEKMLQWAVRYSKAFDRDLYERFIAGKVTDWQEKQRCSSPWYERFDSMAMNTCLKQALKWCPMSVEMREANISENKVDNMIVGDLDIQFEPITAEPEEPPKEEKPTPKAAAKKAKAPEPEPQPEIDDDDFFGENPFAEAVE